MKSIYDNSKISFLMILVFFKPICFQYFSKTLIVDTLFVYAKILVAAIVLVELLLSITVRMKITLNKLYLAVIAFEGWLLLMTIYHKGAVFRSFIDFISIIVLTILITRAYRRNTMVFLNTFRNVIILLNLIQLITELIYRTGMPADLYYNNAGNPLYFVTLDNGTTGLSILGITLVLLCKNLGIFIKRKRKIKFTIEIIICTLTAIFSGSSTALLCTITFLIVIWISKFKELKILEKSWIWAIIYVLLLTIVLLGENSIILQIISALTGKVGFTGRNLIWSKAIKMIKQSLFIGYGKLEHDYISIWNGFYSSHNVVLEILLQGGIIAVILWCISIWSGIKETKKIFNFETKRILVSSLFMILIGLMMEASVHSVYLFSVIALTYIEGNKISLNIQNR